jgi:hypothetical protein
MIWKPTEKKMKQKHKQNGSPIQKTRTISDLEDEMEMKGKTEELLVKQLRPMKGICKYSLTPSKGQT